MMNSMMPMDNLNEVISIVLDCGLVGSHLTIQIDTDNLSSWAMHIHSMGGDYQLSTYDNGGYLLLGQIVTPQALVTSGPEGVVGITRDPEGSVCQIYLPTLSKETLMRSLANLRSTIGQIRMAHMHATN